MPAELVNLTYNNVFGILIYLESNLDRRLLLVEECVLVEEVC